MRSSAFVTCLLLGTSSAAYAGDKVLLQPAPDWIKPAPPIDTAKLDDAAPIVLVLDNQQRIVGARVDQYVDTATRVASTQMQGQLGTITLSWQPDKGDLIVHDVEIVRGAERVSLLKSAADFTVLRREQRLEAQELDGALTATMQAPGLRVGDVLRVRYTITQEDKALGGKAQAYLPAPASPFRATFGRSRLLWPASTPLKLRGYAEGLTLSPIAHGAMREIEVPLPLAKQPEVPDDAPPRFQRLPVIEATSFADWQDVSRTMAPLFTTEGAIKRGGALAGEVATIAKAESDPLRRAAKALALVQDQVRYQLMGMNGGNYVPQKPEETWSTRYGDCKAKTLLLLAMLRALGIEAEPVLASATAGGLVSTRLPAPGAFDHVLVRAVIGGRDYWLDGTQGGTRLEDLGDTPPLRSVLPLRSAGAALMEVPIRPDARPSIALDMTFDNRAGVDLPTVVDFRITMRGGMAEAMRMAQSQFADKERRDFIGGMIQQRVGEIQLSESSMAFDAATGTATIHAHGAITTAWKRDSGRYRLDADEVAKGIDFAPDRAKAAWRAIPVQAPGPMSMRVRTTVLLPTKGAGYALDGPGSGSQTVAGGTVTRTVSLTGDKAVIDQRYDALGGEIAPADLPAARAAAAQLKARPIQIVAPETLPPRWQAVKSDGAAGVAALEAVFAAAIAADPEEPSGYVSRASLRMGVYDYKGGAADLGKAIDLAPAANLYLQRAGVFRMLGDDKRAAADAESARALDPSSDGAIGMLAAIKTDAGDRAGAIALIDPKIEEGGKARFGWMASKAQVLAGTGDTAGAITTLDEAIAAKPGDPDLLNGRCWVKGTRNTALDTALKDCTKSIETADSTAAALDSRAMVFFRLNRLDEALADLNAVLDENPKQADSLFMRGVVQRRLGHAALGDADLAGARFMDPQVDKTYARYGIKP